LTFIIPSAGYTQLLTWSPAFPGPDDAIEITMDATKGNKGLLDFSSNVYVHIGLITSASKNSTDWKYAPFTWGGTDIKSQAIALGNNKWKYSIPNIRTFFNVPVNEDILRVAILFRQGGCTSCSAQRNADGSDMYVKISSASDQVRFDKPAYQPFYNPIPEAISLSTGQSLAVKAISKEIGTLSLSLNSRLVSSKENVSEIAQEISFSDPGNYTISATFLNSKGMNAADSFAFVVTGNGGSVITKPLPPGIRPGINRMPGDTSLILALVAPNKSKVGVLGDFPGSDWSDRLEYQMNLHTDNKTWWIQINGLKPNVEYSYQYLVDASLKIADPYAEKILDPANDGFITAATYPQLKAYPSGKTNGIVSIVKTNAGDYQWKNKFTRPDKTRLVIYELLLRDFLKQHDFNALTDTLNYLSSLGVNAIELMPVGEFEGNESWGYNPSFYFAVDKYYGTENSLRRFIDSCHGRGIAVILDMVLNHATGTCPLAALYWDGVNQRPAANSPWFNITATHPFSVFNDFNHESADTKYFSTRVMEYWLKEYKVDGYRFDLSKGFTQKNNPNNVNAWGAYDASRIAIWKQYYDSIQTYSPGAYTILEHFADNSEEATLSDMGMLLWGNSNFNFNEATMGYVNTSNFDYSIYRTRGWSKPHLVSYMESHDEERLMYKNQNFGNSSGSYSTKSLGAALDRMKLAASFFLLSPGPKMIWQFGELGYDYSINTCTNSTVNNNCRLDNKPITWQYLSDPGRKSLFEWYKKLLKLRKTPAYESTNNEATYNLTGAIKTLTLRGSELNVIVTGNFDVTAQSGNINFPKTGNWMDIKDNSVLNVTQTSVSLSLQPGEYHVYADKTFDQLTPVKDISHQEPLNIDLISNPSFQTPRVRADLTRRGDVFITIYNVEGHLMYSEKFTQLSGAQEIDIASPLSPGIYMIRIQTIQGSKTLKFLKF
jgi:1,4-alpha-glucan branching enzyme